MKLILLNRYFHPDISATSQVLADLAIDQARRGREVHVIASRQLYEDPSANLPASAEHSGVRIHRVWTSRFGRGNLAGRAVDYATFYIFATTRLWSLVNHGDTIIAKTDPPLISVPAAWVARLKGARLVNWLQDVFPEIAERLGVRALSGPVGVVARSLRNYSLRAAEMNVALGERMAATLSNLAGSVPVRVVENWADGRLVWPVDRSDNPLRRRWGLDSRFVVGYSGNMGRAHEFETVLGAAERLRDQHDIVFLFIGAGRQKAWMEQEARRRSLANLVFHSYQPRELLAWSLSVADVHLVTLWPTLEGLIVPSKFYGIAAAGRPTLFVGDPAGEIPRLLTREDCGRVVGSGQVEALANEIRGLRDHPGDAAAMGRRARAAFERHWDLPVALDRWAAILPM